MSEETSQLATPAYNDDQVYDYDAFLSYSRQDTQVAAGIQKGLHGIGRKMGRLHALRVFRDKTDLAASPSLWGKISDALDRSRYLVVVLSPDSADSEWVDKEVAYWLEKRGRDHLLLVMADGTLVWDDTHGRFDPKLSSAAPPALLTEDALAEEPIYVDVSQDDPWDAQNPSFRDKVTDLAAPIHGKPKYELASDDLREQQRFRRFRRLAIAGLAALTVIALVAAGFAFVQRREAVQQRAEAIHQRNDAIGVRMVSDGEAILKKVRGGGDDRALQELLAANRIAPQSTQGGLLTGLQLTATTRKIIRTPDTVPGVGITPDGKRIVTASGDDPVIRVWDADTGQLQTELAGHSEGVSTLALSPDGKRVVSGSYDGKVRLWDLDTGRTILGPLSMGSTWLVAVAISPDGKRIAGSYGVSDGNVRIWDTETGEPVGAPFTLKRRADDVAFSPDSQHLAVSSADTLVVLDANTALPVGEPIDSAGDSFHAVTFSPDGRRIATGDRRNIRLWDADTHQPIGVPFEGHTEPVDTLAFSPDGKLIASGSWDKTVRVWDAERGIPVGEPMLGHEDKVQDLVFTPSGEGIVSGSYDRTIRIWDIRLDNQIGETIPLGNFHTSALSNDGQLIATAPASAEAGNPVVLGDNINEKEVATLARPDGASISALAFSPDKKLLAVGDDERAIELWDVSDVSAARRLLTIPDAQTYPVTGVVFSPDGKLIASSSFEPTVKLWDSQTGNQVGPNLVGAESDINTVAFSPDSKLVAAGGKDRSVHFWNTGNGEPVGDPLTGHTTGVESLAFSPDGNQIATGDDGTVRIWDAHSHQLIGSPMAGHDDSVTGLAFSPDGRLVASGSSDHTVRIWDTQTIAQVGAPLSTDYQTSNSLVFSPDGQRIVASDTGYLSVWPGPAQWSNLLCSKISTNMSREQWKLWVSPDIDYIAGCPDLPIPE